VRGLPLLIKLARQGTDERRAELARIGAAVQEADAGLTTQQQRADQEAGFAAMRPDALAAYAAWARQDAQRRRVLEARRAQLARTEDAARDALREAFSKVKRLESALAIATEQARRDNARRAEKRTEETARAARQD
jgi:hypothetical protein